MKNTNNNNPNTYKQPKEGIARKVGDAIERAGEKLSDAGLKKVGNAVERFGDKIEHSQDKNKA